MNSNSAQKAFNGVKKGRSGLSAEIATRDNSIDFYGLANSLPNPDPVLKRMGKDITVYRDLLCDAHVGANADSRAAGVKSRLWEIDRGKSKSRQAKFITDMFEDLDIHGIIEELLEGALYGYQPAEITWTLGPSRWLPLRVDGKPPEWFAYDSENHLRFLSKDNMFGDPVPEHKFLVARNRPKYSNPYGFPVLSRVFWPLTFKKGGLKFWVTFTEKYGMPWPVGKVRPGAPFAEKEDLLDMLDKMVRDGIAVITDNSSIEFVQQKGGTASSQLYKMLCEFCNSEMSKALLGQTLTTEIGSSGSYAASKTHADVRNDIVVSDSRMVEAELNKLIDWTMEFNFAGSSERPRFILFDEDDVDGDLANRDKTLADTGQVKFTKKYFQNAYGFADDEIDIVAPQQSPPVGTQNFASTPGAPASFAAPVAVAEQDAIDELLEIIPADQVQTGIKKTLTPVIKAIEKAESFAQVNKNIADLFPEIDDTDIQTIVEKTTFLAGVWGRFKNT